MRPSQKVTAVGTGEALVIGLGVAAVAVVSLAIAGSEDARGARRRACRTKSD